MDKRDRRYRQRQRARMAAVYFGRRSFGSGVLLPGPTITTAPVLSGDGSPTVGENLTFTAASATGDTPITYAYDIYVDGVVTATNVTSPYTTTVAGAHDVRVTATNAAGSDTATSNTVTVAGASAIATSSPTLDLNASEGVTEVGGGVSLWEDQAGTFDVAQTSAANRPVFSATAMNSAYPGLTFDGANDVLELASAGLNIGTNDISFALVFSTTETTTEIVFQVRDYISEGLVFEKRSNGRIRIELEDTSANSVSIQSSNTNGVLYDGTPNIFVGRINRASTADVFCGAGELSYFDTNDFSTVTGPCHLSDTPLYVGAGGNTSTFRNAHFNGVISRLIFWNNRALTNQEINDIGAELVSVYGGSFTGPS